ncbi:hypothetical protein Tco_1547508 [Tanacetum coccineum]
MKAQSQYYDIPQIHDHFYTGSGNGSRRRTHGEEDHSFERKVIKIHSVLAHDDQKSLGKSKTLILTDKGLLIKTGYIGNVEFFISTFTLKILSMQVPS